jgi:iron(III) transport system substrate-binding protein
MMATRLLAIALALLTLLAGCSDGPKRKAVVVYSAHGRDILDQFEKKFEEAHPEVDVQTVYMGAEALLDRVRAERKNPQAAVWWGSHSTAMDLAAAEGLLIPYKPSYPVDAGGDAAPMMRHPDNLWTGCFLLPIVLGYQPSRLPASELPKKFADLADPKFKGKIVMRDPAASGTLRTFLGAMIARSIAETGSDARGFAFLKAFDANVHHYEGSPELLFEALEHGPASLTVWNLTDFVFQKQEKGYTFLPAGLDEPVPVVIDAISLVKGPGGETPEARAFYEFVNTLDALAILAKTHARIPVRPDFPREKLLPEIRAVHAEPMVLDRAALAARIPDWMRRYEQEIRGRR